MNQNLECGDPKAAGMFLQDLDAEIVSRIEAGEKFTLHDFRLTPTLAEHLLAGHAPSDPYRRARLGQIKRDILADAWQKSATHPIVVGTDRRMHNGKHRCNVVANTGKAIPVSITFNADRSEKGGKERPFTPSDTIALRHPDIANASRVASVSAMLWLDDEGLPPIGPNDLRAYPDAVEIADTFEKHQSVTRSVRFVSGLKWSRGWRGRFLVYLHYRISRYDHEKADQFLMALAGDERAVTGGITAENAAEMREKVKHENAVARKAPSIAHFFWLMQAWSATVEGVPVSFVWSRTMEVPTFRPPEK